MEEGEQCGLSQSTENQEAITLMEEAKKQHPLHQIAETPTHKLLLKQWLKEEELVLSRISLKETQIDSARNDITHLFIFFFLFHSFSLLLLFNFHSHPDPDLDSTMHSSSSSSSSLGCKRSWVPSLSTLLCSLGIIWAFRYKSDVEAHLELLLHKEKEDAGLLSKCVEELKKKGIHFNLLKEVDALRRAKSLRLENEVVKKWCGRDFVTLFFFSVSCLSLALVRVILCG